MAVIFVTAMDDLSIAVQNLKLGAYDYLVKPVGLKRLRQSVDEVLEKHNAMLVAKQRLGACPTILEEKPLPGPRESCGNLMRPSWPVGFPSAVRRRF